MRTRQRWITTLGLAATALAGPAAADLPERFDTLVADLAAPSPVARLAAERALAADPGLTLADAEAAAAAPDLPAEARARLLRIAGDRFRAAMRPAMGIQFAGEFDGRIRIGNTIPPFDAADKLLPGDLVDAIDGRPVRRDQSIGRSAQFDLQIEIMSRLPGEVMHITGHRGDEPFAAEVTLGTWVDLQIGNAAGGVQANLVEEGWRRRVARLSLLTGAGVLDAAGVETDDQHPVAFSDRPERQILVAGAGRTAAAGGALGASGLFETNPAVRPRLPENAADQRARLAQAELRQLRNLREHERMRLAQTRTRIEEKLRMLHGDLSREQRNELGRQIAVQQRQLVNLESAIERRDRDIARLEGLLRP